MVPVYNVCFLIIKKNFLDTSMRNTLIRVNQYPVLQCLLDEQLIGIDLSVVRRKFFCHCMSGIDDKTIEQNICLVNH